MVELCLRHREPAVGYFTSENGRCNLVVSRAGEPNSWPGFIRLKLAETLRNERVRLGQVHGFDVDVKMRTGAVYDLSVNFQEARGFSRLMRPP